MAKSYIDVRNIIARHVVNDVDDIVLDDALQTAVTWIERNNSLKCMEIFVQTVLDPAAEHPRRIPLRLKPKRFTLVRRFDEGPDGTRDNITPLTQIDPIEIRRVGIGAPTHYWLEAYDYLWVNSIPEQRTPIELIYYRYTDWNDNDVDPQTGKPRYHNDTYWLYDFGRDVIIGRALKTLAPLLRQAGTLQLYAAGYDDALKTLLDADEELKQSNRDDAMNHGRVYND